MAAQEAALALNNAAVVGVAAWQHELEAATAALAAGTLFRGRGAGPNAGEAHISLDLGRNGHGVSNGAGCCRQHPLGHGRLKVRDKVIVVTGCNTTPKLRSGAATHITHSLCVCVGLEILNHCIMTPKTGRDPNSVNSVRKLARFAWD